MSRIRIKNFGPIKEGNAETGGWIEISKVTVFIGNQGAGKSCVAKLISTFLWIEKALVRGDYDSKWFTNPNIFRKRFLKYHRLENFLHYSDISNANKSKREMITEIDFEGEAYEISYRNGRLHFKKKVENEYKLPQIMYVPSERNFISYVKTPKDLKLSSESLKEFMTEFDNAKRALKKNKLLPIENVNVEYDKLNDVINLKRKDYKVHLAESSSGFQSLTPLFLVSDYLSDKVSQNAEEETMSAKDSHRFTEEVKEIMNNETLTQEQKRLAVSALASKFNKQAFINIIEEPEQNLYPRSQWELMKTLLKFNNQRKENKLILTSHSPYIVNFLSIAIQAYDLNKMIEEKKLGKDADKLREKLEKVIAVEAVVALDDVVVYQLDDKGGISLLKDYEGIPSDKNYLNEILAEGNRLFDTLLEIEEDL